MKRCCLLAMLMLLCCNAMARHERDTLGVGARVSFVENLGQWEQPFSFSAQLHNAALFLEDHSITVVLCTPRSHPVAFKEPSHYHAYRMHFVGSRGVTPSGSNPQPTYNNYMLGSDPSRWRGHVSMYDIVRYSGLYDNIDLELYGGDRALKYNFVVHPGGDPTAVAVTYEGTDGLTTTSEGHLLVKTSVRDIVEMKPYVYQTDAAGKEHEVASRWRVTKGKDGTYRATIEVGAYDPQRDLVIDPVLIFSTYTGSTADNWGTTATYDSQKNVYSAGLVFNVGYPVSLGAFQSDFGGKCDIGIFKFDSTGSQRLYATYLGGSQADMPHSLFVNSFDQLLIFGTTGSTNFPVTTGAYQTYHAGGTSLAYEGSNDITYPQGSDIFVSRLSADGQQLLASTYIGGSGNDGLHYRSHYNNLTPDNSNHIYMEGNDSLYYNYGDGARGEIITDNLNNVYIGSTTFSIDFPVTAGCLQPTLSGVQDGVVFKLDHNLRNLLWSTYLGGTTDDAVYSIDVDSAYNLLVCGGTSSTDFPVTDGAYQTTYGGGTADGFVCKLSYDGHSLMRSSFFGKSNYDQLYFVRAGRHDEVFLFGQAKNTGTTLIHNAGYSIANSGMLLARLSPDLSTLRWSTVFGTPGRVNLSPTAFAADICNRVYACGWGRDFKPFSSLGWNSGGTAGMDTSPDAYSGTTDGQDFYIISLDADAATLEYATFFGEQHQSGDSYNGADHVDGGTSRFDKLGTLYQSVCASCIVASQGFPTTAGAWSNSNNSDNCNNAIFRYSVTDDFPVAEFVLPPSGCAPYTLQFTNTGRGSTFHWDFGDGTTSSEANPTHTYTEAGLYTVTLIAEIPHGCSLTDTQQHTVQVLSDIYNTHTPEISCNKSLVQIGVTPVLGATYQWSGDPVSDPTVANPWVDTTGTYILTTTAPGCTQVDTFHVFEYTLVDQWLTTSISCHDSADGSVTFRLGHEIDPDSVSVTVIPSSPDVPIPNSELLLPTSDLILDSLAPDVTYHVTISAYGCTYEQDILLPNPPTPHYTKEFSAALCDDSCSGWINIHYNLSAIPEVPPLDTLIDGLCPGTYITQLTSLGCPLVDTSVIIRDHSLDNLHAWTERHEIYLGESVRLHADGADSASLLWSPADEMDHPDSPQPLATPTDTAVCYTVTATSAEGCTRSDTVCLHCIGIVCGAPDFVIPNAFTPNGDGLNDRICFNADLLTEFHIAIFNRWGQCVYESDDATRCWDGTFNNNKALAGVYTYTCRVRCHNGIETDFKGDITLIR